MSYRPVCETDREEYLRMVQEFYATDAVIRPIPREYAETTFAELMCSDTYTAAYMLEENGKTAGYALLAKTFSQEAGGLAVWVEELYVKPAFRGKGIGSAFLRDLTLHPPKGTKRIRLEVEKESESAVRLYRSLGFDWLAYDQMVLEI